MKEALLGGQNGDKQESQKGNILNKIENKSPITSIEDPPKEYERML
jgi:hypothetical protein